MPGKKAGRPKSELAKSKVVSTKLDRMDHNELKRMAEGMGMTFSETVRYCIHKTYIDYVRNH